MAHDGVVVDVAVVVDAGEVVGQGAGLARVVLAGGDDGGAAVPQRARHGPGPSEDLHGLDARLWLGPGRLLQLALHCTVFKRGRLWCSIARSFFRGHAGPAGGRDARGEVQANCTTSS